MKWRFWIDRGGTFTDIVAVPESGPRRTLKLLSDNPEQYDDAAIEAIRRVLEVAPGDELPEDRIATVKMGTTVATNALLTREGDRTVLAITRGFRDALRIGHQARPDIFALNIQLPRALAEQIVEIDARVDADGAVLTPLDAEAARAALQAAFDDGIRSVAIVLMHGYRYPEHEQQVADLARDIGFTQISASHAVSPLMKLVGRGDTTVVDAYLTPILRRYVDRVQARVGQARLYFMQSSGGLTRADAFRGKDSILSGPAGGIVGAARTSEAAGYDAIIAFDMGGTSTDVSYYAGTFERTFETEVAGVRLRAPMVDIHTVAAGGGSILHFDGQSYRVGPDSAGAVPGPACYRRGGPLAVTDANVMLGKIQARWFPRVFGPDADQALDTDAVARRFSALAVEVSEATGRTVDAQAVAEGFVEVAVETMARAIRRISVERGHDTERLALCSFGGAAGQHACRVADALRMDTVLLHPDAGVLSAWGMGLAEQRALRERAVEARLDDDALRQAHAVADALSDEARAELERDGAQVAEVIRRAHVRYEGTDAALVVPLKDSAAALREGFEAAHERRFGFTTEERDVVVEAVSVEAVAPGASLPEAALAAQDGDPVPVERVAMFSGGQSHDTPVFERSALGAGARINGPAILVEDSGTTVVEPGWRAEITARGDAVLTRVTPRQRPARATDLDPTRLAVFNHRFMSIAEQMGAALEQTAISVNIKERRDYSCALFDAEGRLVANAPHIPVHLGSMGDAVAAVLAHSADDLRPGDVLLINDPYGGGTHLPDLTVVRPIFGDAGALRFFVAARGHHADIGGITPGSMPPGSTTIDQEGARFTNFLLARDGKLRETEFREALTAGPYPARDPDRNVADVTSQIAATRSGESQLRALVAEFGADVVDAYMTYVRQAAAEAVRQVVDRLPEGRARCPMDDGCAIEVAVTVDRAARTARIDFTGTSEQQPTNINAPSSVCRAAVLYVFRTLTGEDIPLNAGCLEPLEVVIPEGSMLAPQPPAAVVAGNVETSQVICDALFTAVGALAGSQGTMNNLTFGNERHQYYETIGGGAGAGPDFDGASAVHTHMTNSRLTDPEVLEWRYPVLVERFGVREGSGGHGQHRGGDGIVRALRFREAMHVALLANRRETAPPGVGGGADGAPGRGRLLRHDGREETLGHRAEVDVEPDDLLIIETPGGGGYGKEQTEQ